MRRIIIKEARPGMRLARGVSAPLTGAKPTAQPWALATGTDLTLSQIVHMHEVGLYDLWVEEPELAFFDELVDSHYTTAQQRLAEASLGALRALVADGIGGSTPGTHAAAGPAAMTPREEQGVQSLIRRHRQILEELIRALVRMAPMVPSFEAMAMQHESLLRHSAGVSVLAMLLGLQLEEYLVQERPRLNGRQASDVLSLALGCLFHDVGELQSPPPQQESLHDLWRPGHETSLDAAKASPVATVAPGAKNDWRLHTGLGYAAVRKFIDPSAANVVLHHHQHFDGTGFAVADKRELRQSHSGIHIFSRIAMAADIFQHLLLPPQAGVAQPVVRALWAIQQEPIRRWFDPMVLDALLNMMTPFVQGMVVTLSDRRQGVVAGVKSGAGCAPRVRILKPTPQGEAPEAEPEEIVDLAASTKEGDLVIVETGSSEVRDCLYGAPRTRALVAA